MRFIVDDAAKTVKIPAIGSAGSAWDAQVKFRDFALSDFFNYIARMP